MNNHKFKKITNTIYQTTEEDEFWICSISGIDCLFLDLNNNMYEEFLYYYGKKTFISILWDLKYLGVYSIKQSIREYNAITKVIEKALTN